MTPSRDAAGRRRWWTVGLLVHVGLVGLLLLTDPPSLAGDPSSWAARADYAGRLTLSAPWWLVSLASSRWNVLGDDATPLAQALPVLLNLVLHAAAVPLFSRRPVAGGEAGHGPGRGGTLAARRAPSASTVFFAAAAAGALVWAVWLGWDDTASYDVLTGQVESPYVSLQVLGCAVSVGVVTAVMASRWSPVACAGGVAAGFWFVWTAWAANDETGLFLVGALLLWAGLPFGTAAAAAVGRAVGRRPARTGAGRRTTA